MTTKIEDNKLEDNKLEKISGGYIYARGDHKNLPWEVLNDGNGEVVGRYATREEAEKMAKEKSESTKELTTWEEVSGLRNPAETKIKETGPSKPIIEPKFPKWPIGYL